MVKKIIVLVIVLLFVLGLIFVTGSGKKESNKENQIPPKEQEE